MVIIDIKSVQQIENRTSGLAEPTEESYFRTYQTSFLKNQNRLLYIGIE